ncbi:uncharacterized protein NECHADRAFT_74375 [Fusarium vanettenii 77-13-4]|uniref:Uncharacterized protein n=1 Tax=Fusarium vanettenii (strain ATCC MYA-4622 / CBS 123669 / FGSC 9596 / NRRL 45880 / 77-13-4) TaxID=660122 RepID=C7YWP8_FUSV7|nr:uncharacterized protein NECHADRAFT_74375 [Fusarium vanettenii 77-13-4]EEU43996.1 hypothetical protein NECHADRAFT_74375 [Fusarium vanettenii 77-13-4]
MDFPSVMHSAVADQYQADETRHGPSPASFFTGPAARQIQNPQHIFMNYPEPVPLVRNRFPSPKEKILTASKQRPGSAFQPFRARDGCPDIDLLALQPAPQASTHGMYPTSNNYFQAGTQEPNYAYDMHRFPTGAGFNGYPQPSPNAWYSQPLPNVAGAAFQGMSAGQASHQVSPQYPQAYGSIEGTASMEMLGNQTPQPSVHTNGAAPWGTFVDQTPHGGYHPSANLFLATPQQSLVSQSFVNTTGTAPQALQSSVDITSVASGGTLVGQTPCQSYYLSNNTASAAPQESAVNQLSQPSVNITKVALRGRSVNQAARKRSPQVPPQALQSSVNATGAASQGTRGNQTPPGSHQPFVNTAATGLQKSPDCQPSKPPTENTGAAHCETLGSQSSHESHQSVTDRAVATLMQILDNQNSQHSVSATGTAPQEKSVSQTSLGSQQPSTNVAVTAPQKSPVHQTSQLSVDTTEAATQGEPVSQAFHGSHQPSTNTAVTTPVSQLFQPPAVITGAAHQRRSVRRNGLEVHSRIHGSQVNGVRKSTSTRPASYPPTPPAEDMLKNGGCTSWEADMARHLHKRNVMGLYKVGDSLCDVHAASGDLVKLAKRDITPDGEHFWCHTMLGQRIRPIDTEYLNGKMVCLSNGAFVGMEDSQGNMIVPKWQFADPVDLESNSNELKDQSDFNELINFDELIDQSKFNEPKNQSKPKLSKNQIEFRRLQEVLKKRGAAFKRETETIQGLKPGCDPMWF